MKKTLIRALFILTAIAVLTAVPVMAAKPNPKNKATTGTTQLKSLNDPAQVGTTYTLGKAQPINITLNSITYTIDPLVADKIIVPTATEKLMVLNFTLHNPNKRNFDVVWSCLKFTAVDSNSKNYEYFGDIMSVEGGKGYVKLLPAQKSNFCTVIKVPAKADIPKLIIESRDRLVLRYPLTDKNVKPLLPPVADPADKTGFTALENVPAKMGDYYPIGPYTTKLESAVFSDTPIQGSRLKPGNRYLIMILSVRNDTPFKQGLAWSTIVPKLLDQDNMEVKWNGTVLFASRDESIGAPQLEPKQEVRLRCYYQVPSNLGLKSLSLQNKREGRLFTYDFSTLK